MKNLQQIRAKNALEACNADYKGVEKKGTVVKKVPVYVMQNGLLGALAFAMDKQAGYETVFKACLKHCRELCGCTSEDLTGWSRELSDMDAFSLRAVTAEVLAFLNFLRRYVKE